MLYQLSYIGEGAANSIRSDRAYQALGGVAASLQTKWSINICDVIYLLFIGFVEAGIPLGVPAPDQVRAWTRG
ncbi:hypothetical protein HW932_03395 [Allochromatium humboldtianum]|uniref:Uncharacterized protein n=1 Tax=Allochromatium humboldtianum TaxID=504901 RepID=A0A850RBG4_9GAMM|nr:hypothetical protein [Allochromatium humboldtianum]NVZ08300.1 hypothetical protein [Allochromatium humboldtianum]